MRKRANIFILKESVFKLHYLHFGIIGRQYGYNIKEVIDYPYNAFKIPEGMSVEEAFSVLSYLICEIERDLNLEECSQKAITILNNSLKKFNFDVLPNYDGEFVSLYTITGNMKRFKKSKHYSKYFEWFKSDVSYADVKKIYESHGYSFEKPDFTSNSK